MSLIHCAAQNNHQDVLQFIHDSLDRYNINTLEKVPTLSCVFYFVRQCVVDQIWLQNF